MGRITRSLHIDRPRMTGLSVKMTEDNRLGPKEEAELEFRHFYENGPIGLLRDADLRQRIGVIKCDLLQAIIPT